MALSIHDMLSDLTDEGVLDDLKEVAQAIGLTVTAWQSGEPALGLAAIFSRQIARLWNTYIVKALRAGFLDYATGDWLTLTALAIYGVRRRGETFAALPVTVENRAGGLWTILSGDIRIRNANGKTFRNVTEGTLPSWGGSGAYPTLTLTFEADEAGSASDTPISSIVASPVTAPEGVFAQANTVAGFGQDEESDGRLRERCRLSSAALSPGGPLAAYHFIALTTRRPGEDDDEPDRLLATETDDVYVNVTRVRVLDKNVYGSGLAPGQVAVYLASDTGPAGGSVGVEGSDVFLVNAALVRHVLPPGMTLTTLPAVALPVTVNIALYVDRASNVTGPAAVAAATQAEQLFFRDFTVGGHRLSLMSTGRLFATEVAAKASESSPGIFKASVTFTGATLDGTDVVVGMTNVVVPTFNITATVVTQ
ncbi:baseplate J/gp47 family protein [Sorangium sp. So ce1667]